MEKGVSGKAEANDASNAAVMFLFVHMMKELADRFHQI